MDLLILLIFITLVASQQVSCQEEMRSEKGGAEGNIGGGGSAYSQRISPHRMMHFGKRLQPARLFSNLPSGYELYQPQPASELMKRIPSLFPMQLSRGQTLDALPDDDAKNTLYYSYESPQQQLPERLAYEIELVQPLLGSQLDGQRFSRLLGESSLSSLDSADNQGNEVGKLSSEQQQPQAQQQQGSISLNTRSMQGSKNYNLPKKYIADILYGRPTAGSIPAFGVFNKKAEPKDNFFMHFG